MNARNSLRRRLPLSYASIALFTALALAAMLLLALHSYYQEQERRYLLGNARTIGIAMQLADTYDLPAEAVQAQAESFSFFIQARVRLLDTQGNPLADSGSPIGQRALTLHYGEQSSGDDPGSGGDWSFSASGPAESGPDGAPVEEGSGPFWWPGNFFGSGPAPEGENNSASVPEGGVVLSVPVAGSFYGFDLDQTEATALGRSATLLTVPIPDETGTVLGYVELSEGPAYGREVINSIAWGLAFAASVAVVLAVAVGWLMSRRISSPLVALAEATSRMAGGELSVRADLNRTDEIGMLAGAFNAMATRIEETVTTLRRFASDASHQLFTPITALRTHLELAIAEPRRRNHLSEALGQLDRLESLAANLLDLSRLESQSDPSDWTQIELSEAVKAAAERFAAEAEQAGLDFSLAIDQQPSLIQGDKNQIEQLLENLVGNAIKFTPSGGELWLRLEAHDAYAELQVEDTGIGLNPEGLPQLFERFHRGSNASAYQGNGLGLAIAKAIVDNHHGEIWAEATPRGTRFVVRLPLPAGA